IAIKRHAGTLRYLYGTTGKKTIAEGKDLTNVKYIIGTGGALTRLEGIDILRKMVQGNGDELLPSKDVRILVDRLYIMASLGVISEKYPKGALKLLLESLEQDKK
ncbi:glutamate mutase L, partial [Vallitalea guaymasensis]